ncbi:hypothetical protein BRD17_04605 [Halobacteriales archaeon SW_7_68_16]|nr:MAG: hypothetical protein BRD17_04605 [Halobacteriales archaeon SW_7_68_16]
MSQRWLQSDSTPSTGHDRLSRDSRPDRHQSHATLWTLSRSTVETRLHELGRAGFVAPEEPDVGERRWVITCTGILSPAGEADALARPPDRPVPCVRVGWPR